MEKAIIQEMLQNAYRQGYRAGTAAASLTTIPRPWTWRETTTAAALFIAAQAAAAVTLFLVL